MLDGLRAHARSLGYQTCITHHYQGNSDLLILYGVGHIDRAPARNAHLSSHRNVVLWDVGYFGRKKVQGYLRCSINHDHPQHLLPYTTNDPSRWAAHEIRLKDTYNPKGPIILVGLGPKTRIYLPDLSDWELHKLAELKQRFPGHRIIFRPKPRRTYPKLIVETDAESEIETLLEGASLVVCRHSNVAVDAIIANIPYETDDGAALWLYGKPYTPENRLDFLQRLSWWQWHKGEAPEAWDFLMQIFHRIGVHYGP